MCPDTVALSIVSSSTNMILTIFGLDDAKTYDLFFWATRSNSTATSQDFVINATTKTVSTNTNLANEVVFNDIRPSGGVVIININKRVGNFIYLAGFAFQPNGSIPVNQPPIVTLGGSQTITTIPGSTSVTPSIIDEGGALTYQWVQLSGSAATIGSPTFANTTFSGMTTAGTRVFRLNVTDTGGLVGSSQISIIVNAAGNTLPVVNAGADQVLTLPTNSTTLNGTNSDADGTITSRTWTLQPGLTGGTIASPNTNSTGISNLQAGTYVYRLTVVDNSGGTSFDEVEIIVNPAPVNGTLVLPSAGSGEYQAGFIDKNGLPWGVGNVTNIGTGNTGPNGVVQRVITSPNNLRMKFVAGGLHHMAFVDVNGFVWSMGDNDQYQHGVGNNIDNFNAARLLVDSAGNTFNNIESVSAFYLSGANGMYAIKDSAGDRSLWCWGEPLYGFRGNGTDSIANDSIVPRPVKVPLPDGKTIKQIASGTMAIALFTDGTVATLGRTNNANLGYTPATTKEYQSFRILPELSGIVEVAGAGSFNLALAADGKLYGWGFFGNYMGIANGLPIARPTLLTNIMNALPAGRRIVRVVANTVSCHVILSDSSLWGWGNSAQGTVGNGFQLQHSNPYAWDFNRDRGVILLPVQIAPGIKFINISGSNVFTFHTYALRSDSTWLGWGKNKANVLAVRIVSATSALTAQRGNSWDVPWPKPIQEFGTYSTAFVSTSPICITNPGTLPCSGYTPPANTAPVANAGTNQNIAAAFGTLNGNLSSDNLWIQFYEWTQVSGPSTAVISLPGASSTPISGLVPGIYTFNLKVTDNGWLSSSANVTVTVTNGDTPKPLKGKLITIKTK
jgi:hypothetical protein